MDVLSSAFVSSMSERRREKGWGGVEWREGDGKEEKEKGMNEYEKNRWFAKTLSGRGQWRVIGTVDF